MLDVERIVSLFETLFAKMSIKVGDSTRTTATVFLTDLVLHTLIDELVLTWFVAHDDPFLSVERIHGPL